MPKEPTKPARRQTLQLDDRAALSVTAVQRVESFDPHAVAVLTDHGRLCIGGRELHITHLDLQAGQLRLGGHISALRFDEPSTGGLLRRLLR